MGSTSNEGNALSKGFDRRDAIAKYSKAIQLNPTFAEAHLNRGVAIVENGFHSFGSDDLTNALREAISDFSDALTIRSNYAAAYLNRAIALRWLNNSNDDVDIVVADLSKAIELGQNSPTVFLRRAGVLYGAKRYDEAFLDFNAAVANNPKWIEAIVDRAVALRGIDELDQAIADITIAITAKPDLHYLYMIRGVFFSQQNQFDQAVSDFSEGLRRWESDSLYFNRGSVYLLQGDRKRAKADFAAALEKHGVLDAWSHADWTYFNRGIACLLDSDVPQAVADFTEAIRINPKLIRAYLNRSTAYHALGKSDEAEADLEHAKQLLREN